MIPNTDPNIMLSSSHGYNGDNVQEIIPEGESNEDQTAHIAIPEHGNNTSQFSRETHIRDREVYRYYANKAGYRNTAIFLFFLGACQASNNFQCMCLSKPSISLSVL